MSHFTHLQTCFQNLCYLEKALNKLNFSFGIQENSSVGENHSNPRNLVMPQSNGYDIEFNWNGKEYELMTDLSFWNQDYPLEAFTSKITQQYASEVIIGETQKIGFQPVKSKQNDDGSSTLVLERWNSAS